jgi:Rrf2 family protein
MIWINRRTEYALISLKHLYDQRTRGLVTAKELSERYGLPHVLLSKILQTLTRQGILTSEQGARGGYRIARDLKQVSFLSFYEMINGPYQYTYCESTGGKSCSIEGKCSIVLPMRNLGARIAGLMESVTLEEIISNGSEAAVPPVNHSDHGSITTVSDGRKI